MDAAPGRRPRGARSSWRRALALIGIIAGVFGLALLVARPRVEPPAATPYAGVRGASRAQAAGLAIHLRRGAELLAVQPGVSVQPGDTLRFKVRGERPRYLIVQLRDGDAPPAVVFPTGGSAPAQARRVQPGETLPLTPAIGAAPGAVVVVATFADRPFAAGDAPADAEVVTVRVEKSR